MSEVTADPSAPKARPVGLLEEGLRSISRARTLNEVNATYIGMCNIMTPVEAVALQRMLNNGGWRFPPDAVGETAARAISLELQSHATKLANDLLYAGKDTIEPFRRELVRPGIWRFSAGGKRHGKALVLGFTGNADRLMMPSPTYLQHFSAAEVDIVFLVDRARRGYSQGLPGIADSLPGLVSVLPELVATSEYRAVAVTGTSSGGLPSVMAGLGLKAQSVLAIGCASPADRRWAGQAESLLTDWRAASPGTKVAIAFGAQAPQDQAATEVIAALTGAEMIAVSHPERAVKHNAAYSLVMDEQYGAFAHRHLGLGR